MSSILTLIAEYKADLSIFPTVVILFVLVTLLCYVIFNKYKWVKYIPALVGIISGLFFFFRGFNNLVEPGGLDLVWRGVYLFVSGCIALGAAWIIALLASMTAIKPKKTQKKQVTKVQKKPVKKTGQSARQEEKVKLTQASSTNENLDEQFEELAKSHKDFGYRPEKREVDLESDKEDLLVHTRVIEGSEKVEEDDVLSTRRLYKPTEEDLKKNEV